MNKTPIDAEFLNFAEDFSTLWHLHDPGETPLIFHSQEGKHKIELHKVLLKDKTGEELSTPVRVNIPNQLIQFSKSKLTSSDRYTPNFVFYMILWCKYNMLRGNDYEADAEALKLYISLEKPIREIQDGLLHVFSEVSNTDYAKNRFVRILQTIHKIKSDAIHKKTNNN